MRREYHKESKVSRQAGGRANQKARTRAAIVEAASAMLRRGAAPTVAAAADEAKVSRATAYRYFPSQEALLVEVADVSPAVAPVEEAVRRPAPSDPEARLLALLDTLNPIVLAEEVSMRHALRVYLDTWLESRAVGREAPPVREGRRVRWLDEALESVRRDLPEERWVRLRAALSLTLGTDALVVMKDVCRLGDEEALDVLRWAAAALLRAGLDAARPPARKSERAARRR
jgi:AcrR family transcriptional regulator